MFNFAIDNWIATLMSSVGAVAAVYGDIRIFINYRSSKPHCWVYSTLFINETAKKQIRIRHTLPNTIVVKGPFVNGVLKEQHDKHLFPGEILEFSLDMPKKNHNKTQFSIKHERGNKYGFYADW